MSQTINPRKPGVVYFINKKLISKTVETKMDAIEKSVFIENAYSTAIIENEEKLDVHVPETIENTTTKSNCEVTSNNNPMESLFSCFLCLEIMCGPNNAPATLTCGHSACLLCLQNLFNSKSRISNKCPECRYDISHQEQVHLRVSVIARTVIENSYPELHRKQILEEKEKKRRQKEIIEKRKERIESYLNGDGVPVVLGTLKDCKVNDMSMKCYSMPSTRVYYCGRVMSDKCKNGCCDGVCGPNGGCPCNSCEEFMTENILYNSDGAPIHLGKSNTRKIKSKSRRAYGIKTSNVFYCGRRMNQCKCGRCNGVCGPTNGCPCDSCDKIDHIDVNALIDGNALAANDPAPRTRRSNYVMNLSSSDESDSDSDSQFSIFSDSSGFEDNS